MKTISLSGAKMSQPPNQPCAAAIPAGASRLPSLRPMHRVAELGSHLNIADKTKRMKNKFNIKRPALGAVLGAFILILTSTVGCTTSRPAPVAEKTPAPVPDAVAICRATLHNLEGAKRTWALEHRQRDSEVPSDTDLFGRDAYMFEKPKCPSGGTYTLGAVENHPLCSIPGHVY